MTTALAAVLALAIAAHVGARQYERAKLQGVAEDAALAGMRAIRDSAGTGDGEIRRREAAIAASRAVVNRLNGVQFSVTASVSPIAVSVKIADTSSLLGRISGIEVVGKAGYAAPLLAAADADRALLHNRLAWGTTAARSKW